MNILNEIAEKTRERIEKDKIEMPREDLIREIQQKKGTDAAESADPVGDSKNTAQFLSGTEKTWNVLYL